MLDLFDEQIPLTQFSIRVTPGARKERIERGETPEGKPFFRIYVNAPAQDGKANQSVIALIAKSLGVSKNAVKIISGLTNREKRVEIRS